MVDTEPRRLAAVSRRRIAIQPRYAGGRKERGGGAHHVVHLPLVEQQQHHGVDGAQTRRSSIGCCTHGHGTQLLLLHKEESKVVELKSESMVREREMKSPYQMKFQRRGMVDLEGKGAEQMSFHGGRRSSSPERRWAKARVLGG
jgi:hypothetical protein